MSQIGVGPRYFGRFATRMAAEIPVAAIGIGLIVGAVAARQTWLDRHFLPILFVSRDMYVFGESVARIAVGAFGAALALLGPRYIGRIVTRGSSIELIRGMVPIVLAFSLALGTSEIVLRYTYPRPKEAPPAAEEPRRIPDPQLGWIFAPGREGHDAVGVREIDYSFDAAGYRVRRVDDPLDPDRPAILFTGESIIAGYGLTWEESIPAQVEALTGIESVNLAVFGFANDQAYLRLARELPRFGRPVAVVSLFMPSLFDRNLDDDRPHLDADLELLPAVNRWRLAALAKWLVPYRSKQEIERGIATTRSVLRATVDLSRARGAEPLIVVPQFGAETEMEKMLRHRILDQTGLPYIRVELDPAWRLPGDVHPDAKAARAIAAAVAARIGGR